MRLISITIKAAFQDLAGYSADAVAEQLVTHLRDGFGADVAFTTDRTEQTNNFPDAAEHWTDAQLDQWQEFARLELETL
jgi:hypothetical protein